MHRRLFWKEGRHRNMRSFSIALTAMAHAGPMGTNVNKVKIQEVPNQFLPDVLVAGKFHASGLPIRERFL